MKIFLLLFFMIAIAIISSFIITAAILGDEFYEE